MMIVFGSAFRNSAHSVVTYMDRVARHARTFDCERFRVIAVEGDSTDNTRLMLKREAEKRKIDLDLRTCDHGKRVFGSTEEPERLKALSAVGNEILAGVKESDDILVYIESDLEWDSRTVMRQLILAAACRVEGFDVFAPLVMAGRAFYDIWGFRKNGVRFNPFFPYHPDLDHLRSATEIDSAGSCLVMRAEIARACRIRNDYGLVGLCEDIRAHGFKIAVVPQLEVFQA